MWAIRVNIQNSQVMIYNQGFMDCIHLTGIRGYSYVGYLPEEKVLGQWFEVDLNYGSILLKLRRLMLLKIL